MDIVSFGENEWKKILKAKKTVVVVVEGLHNDLLHYQSLGYRKHVLLKKAAVFVLKGLPSSKTGERSGEKCKQWTEWYSQWKEKHHMTKLACTGKRSSTLTHKYWHTKFRQSRKFSRLQKKVKILLLICVTILGTLINKNITATLCRLWKSAECMHVLGQW